VSGSDVIGPRWALEVEGGFDVTRSFTVALGLRGVWEQYDGDTTDDPNVHVSRRVLGGGLLLTARYRILPLAGLTPYAGVLGEMNWVRLRYDGPQQTTVYFPAVGPVFGLALPAGPGAALLEGSWRNRDTYQGRQNAPIAAFGVMGGYRLRF
jgi:hypothetical protein